MNDSVTIRVEVATLGPRKRVALLQATRTESPRLIGARFVDCGHFDNEGEFRAHVADALAQLLDETLGQ
jgi:hypothetical protein